MIDWKFIVLCQHSFLNELESVHDVLAKGYFGYSCK